MCSSDLDSNRTDGNGTAQRNDRKEPADINYLYASESVVTTEHGFAVAEKHVKENPWI